VPADHEGLLRHHLRSIGERDRQHGGLQVPGHRVRKLRSHPEVSATDQLNCILG
jgi:hypothetical protein